jgi:hypothetical protein
MPQQSQNQSQLSFSIPNLHKWSKTEKYHSTPTFHRIRHSFHKDLQTRLVSHTFRQVGTRTPSVRVCVHLETSPCTHMRPHDSSQLLHAHVRVNARRVHGVSAQGCIMSGQGGDAYGCTTAFRLFGQGPQWSFHHKASNPAHGASYPAALQQCALQAPSAYAAARRGSTATRSFPTSDPRAA